MSIRNLEKSVKKLADDFIISILMPTQKEFDLLRVVLMEET